MNSVPRRRKQHRVIVKKITTRRREDGGVDKNVKKVDEVSIEILPINLQATAATHIEILVAYFRL